MRKFNKKFIILGILTLVLISVPFNFANAGWLMDAAADTFIFVTVGWMFALVKGFLVLLTGLMATGTDAMLKMQVQNSGVVASAWNLVRQFANMFFIVIMIVMAFYTIFDLGGYNFKSLIGKFIVAALLINFSLVICGIIIDISQSISQVFLQAIGSVGERIGQGTSLGNRFGVNLSQGPGTVPVDLTAWQSAVKAFADIILLGIVFFSMAVLFVMTFIRIPILWGLMIFSPVAWITYILPSTKDINKKWWNNFIGWNAFFPIYLFFVYIGVYMLSEPNRTTILSGTNTVSLMGINFEDLFYYSLIGMVLIGGAKFAMSASMAAGAGGVALGVWGRGVAMRRAAWRGTGIPGAIGAKRKELAEEGYRIPFTQKRMFGEQQRKEREAKFGALLGVRGMELQGQREFLSKTEKEYKNLQDRFDTGKVSQADIEAKAKAGNASRSEDYAYIKMMAKLGNLDASMYSKTLKELSENPLAAKDFAQTAKDSKFSNLQGKEVVEMATGVDEGGTAVHADLALGNLNPAKKEMIRFVQSDERVRAKLTQEQFKRMVDILGGPNTTEGKSFITDVGESRPDLVVDYNLATAATRDKTIKGFSIQEIDPATGAPKTSAQIDAEVRERHYAGVVTVGAQKLAQLPIETDPTKPQKTWNQPEFQDALTNYLTTLKRPATGSTPKTIKAYNNFVSRIWQELANIKNPTEKTEKQLLFQTIETSIP